MALLLLAQSPEFQFGGRLCNNARRDHVLVLDTSAWMAADLPNRAGATLMDAARASALGWLRAVPESDRVLLVRADALATPATPWEIDRRKISRAIVESQPGATALNLSQSLEFARQLQRGSRLPALSAGEIALRRVRAAFHRRGSEQHDACRRCPAGFRVLAVDDTAVENCGLRSVGARRSATDPGAPGTFSCVRATTAGRRKS